MTMSTMTVRRALLSLLTLACLTGPLPAGAQDKPVSAFFGEYEGRSISSTEGGLTKRDLSVSIQPKGKGFTLKWTTVTHRAGGRTIPSRVCSVGTKSYDIHFRPSGRPNIFASAMRRNKFGGAVIEIPSILSRAILTSGPGSTARR